MQVLLVCLHSNIELKTVATWWKPHSVHVNGAGVCHAIINTWTLKWCKQRWDLNNESQFHWQVNCSEDVNVIFRGHLDKRWVIFLKISEISSSIVAIRKQLFLSFSFPGLRFWTQVMRWTRSVRWEDWLWYRRVYNGFPAIWLAFSYGIVCNTIWYRCFLKGFAKSRPAAQVTPHGPAARFTVHIPRSSLEFLSAILQKL